MASGSIPVVWTREGVGDLFPSDFIVGSVAEAADLILGATNAGTVDDLSALAGQAVEHLDLPFVVDQWTDALELGGARWAK